MANKIFTVLKANVGAEVGDTSSAFATIIGRFINRRYFQTLRAINWKNIRPDYTVDMVSGTQDYALPNDFGKPVSVYNTTSDNELDVMDLGDLYRFHGSEITSTGTVERCAFYEEAVTAQPSSASQLSIVSASASDTTQTIQIRGIASSVEVYETQTLTGQSAVTSTNSYTRITGISFDAVRAGKVTITSNSAAVTNAVIPIEVLDTRYKLMKVHYVPTTTDEIAIPYIIKPQPLSQDYDYPAIDIGDLIELGAISDALKYKRQYQKSQTYELMFTQGLADYVFDQENIESPTVFNPATFSRQDLY